MGSGGAQRQIVNLALLFSSRGHKTKILTYDEASFFKDILDDYNIEYKCISSKTILGRIFKIRNAIRQGEQNVVISFLETPNFLASVSTIGGRKWKLITNERSAKPESFVSTKSKIFKWFERYSDRIVTNSIKAAELWAIHYPKYKNKLETIYNPILIQNDELNYVVRKNGRICIVVAASYQKNKNIIGLIEAVNKMRIEDRNKFTIEWYGRIEATIGDSSIYENAKDLLVKYKIENIKLNSETKNITNIMREADYVCLISKIEGLPNTICEGMMLGKPIIMSKVSDYHTLVDNSNGFLCDPNDIDSIKSAILNAINTTDNNIVTMGIRFKEKARKLFDKDKIVDKWFEVINSIGER